MTEAKKRVAIICPSFRYAEGGLRVDYGARFNSRDTGVLPDGLLFEIVTQPRYLRGRQSKFDYYKIMYPDFRLGRREYEDFQEAMTIVKYFGWEEISL